jgi:hypothetical protein
LVLPGAELTGVHGAIGIADVFEDGGQRFGGVQVVVQASVKVCRQRRTGTNCLVHAIGKAVGFHAQFEIAQTIDGRGRRFQSVEREVELSCDAAPTPAGSAWPPADNRAHPADREA